MTSDVYEARLAIHHSAVSCDYLQIRIYGRRVSETNPNTSAILRFAPAFTLATHWTRFCSETIDRPITAPEIPYVVPIFILLDSIINSAGLKAAHELADGENYDAKYQASPRRVTNSPKHLHTDVLFFKSDDPQSRMCVDLTG